MTAAVIKYFCSLNDKNRSLTRPRVEEANAHSVFYSTGWEAQIYLLFHSDRLMLLRLRTTSCLTSLCHLCSRRPSWPGTGLMPGGSGEASTELLKPIPGTAEDVSHPRAFLSLIILPSLLVSNAPLPLPLPLPPVGPLPV